ncbi:MAG: hypothetical protein JSV63_02695 [Candidatus Aenigmatarchaeota archaeon]|nr:MAG: hypothetical protein JSV63_02695 [Candidatus Aenigmarchaeota archaeon]
MASSETPSMLFRVLVSGITSILVMTTMSLGVRFVANVPPEASVTGELIGNFIQPAPGTFYVAYNFLVVIIGVLTFLGSFYVLSKE